MAERKYSLAIRPEVPAKYQKLVDRAECGSVTAALKLHCLSCSSWQPLEITHCPVTTCALYGARPYQGEKTKRALSEAQAVAAARLTEVRRAALQKARLARRGGQAADAAGGTGDK